ncbi:hypothetical protein [Deinococcus radiodurans]|jgi:hypothetical protein|uniref:Uncharacterized protein n=1 Tax=Deinococcus radiodurans (strain ATCC 13939 / DSM 20539 / JCM 16871 / CCUG 27074 / LMG 4051 / NBRC 15346 / NCIMB 9279 / VKM B-1422 / R1) TaxID=243230 RepID=Q9RZ67_DEIRA|nr:hypothetical protein [Deinococcus radiodurans]AAF12370.1 hypothetical protein DR_A0087 [Deinococcus radiodurans R1 = ATCC 13939 = DSM 20539]ANC72947.1 hypothetical protein A2G07_13925 [Deinococcus radiodurans R1 = ATCC 13939 = DSM 20539]QEM72905.1 hypothetical protein DXG80_13895 [Deinococcus radiodurans]QIP30416.1 hypothetical protein HAV23_14280 [Deinococcus radiodurans]QIP33225.1 hypothetical protein HAV35_13710 [Deinococcus radiodurans]
MVAFDLSTLDDEPEFHLDQLLELLRQTPDGFTTRRWQVGVLLADDGVQYAPGWEANAQGYAPRIIPAYRCGFLEDGDGKVLMVITGRVQETEGKLTLSTLQRVRRPEKGEPYLETVFSCTVTLGERMPFESDEWENPCCGRAGLGESRHPGTAALIAYLMAWGVVK